MLAQYDVTSKYLPSSCIDTMYTALTDTHLDIWSLIKLFILLQPFKVLYILTIGNITRKHALADLLLAPLKWNDRNGELMTSKCLYGITKPHQVCVTLTMMSKRKAFILLDIYISRNHGMHKVTMGAAKHLISALLNMRFIIWLDFPQ